MRSKYLATYVAVQPAKSYGKLCTYAIVKMVKIMLRIMIVKATYHDIKHYDHDDCTIII